MPALKRNEEKKVKDLCHVLSPLIASGEYARALALAVLTFAHVDFTLFRKLCDKQLLITGKETEISSAMTACFPCGDSIDEEDLFAKVCDAPLMLVYWLDGMLTYYCSCDGAFPAWVYHIDDVSEITLQESEKSALDLPADYKVVYICRKLNRGGPKASAEKQGLSPDSFTPNWYVVPDMPDPQQPMRRVEVCSPGATFRSACDKLLKDEKINLYLAEFEVTPVFDSIFKQAGEVKTWAAKGLKNESEMISEALRHLVAAKELGARIIVFPELTFPKQIHDAVSDWLSENNCGSGSESSAILWVVAGSFHYAEDDTDVVVNKSYMIDQFGDSVKIGGGDVRRDWMHVKLTSVALSAVKEGNSHGDKITLAHTAMGMHAIVICLDLAQQAARDKVPLSVLPLSWLWVPSMSKTVHAHLERTKELGINWPVTVACANQAKAKFSDEFSLDGDGLQSFVFRSGGSVKGSQCGANGKFFSLDNNDMPKPTDSH